MPGRRAVVVGVIGGVGSGKSSVANELARHANVRIIDADAAGHQALTHPYIQQQIRRRFGDEVFNDRGEIERRRLAALVFGSNPEQIQARLDLNHIVHPQIRSQLQQELDNARQDCALDVIILDAALLLEAGWNDLCDAVVYIDTPREQRLARVLSSRGWSAEDLARREQSQLPLEDKRAAADFVVDNSGLIEDAGRQLWSWIRQQPPKTEDRGSRMED
jgi:dephospho-CoA kinase